jgi:O-antigen/teichoic acid export membrane protein
VIIALALPITYFIALIPALSRSYASDLEEFRHLIQRSLQLSLMAVVPLLVGGTLLAGPIIGLLYGPAYAQSAAPFRILLWSAALVILRSTYTEALKGTGHQGADLRCALTSASINVGLNLLLIPRYGMLGAASATVAADVVWAAMAYYYFHRLLLPREPLPSVKAPLCGGLAMGGFLWLAQQMLWSERAVLAVVVYFLVLLAMGESTVRSWVRYLSKGAR